MFLELLTILFVIVLSAILCWKDVNRRCMFSHILVGLSGLVFYKLAYTYKLTSLLKISNSNENFADFQTEINKFMTDTSGNVPSANEVQTLSASQIQEYNNKLDTLISSLRDYTNAVNNPTPNTGVSGDNLQQLSLESQQQYQMFQIDYLKKQLQNMKNIITTSQLASDSINYKPIKVFSSCVVSNADGTTVSNIPLKQQQSNIGNIPNPIQQSLDAINATASQSTTGSGPSLLSSGASISLAPESGVLGSIIKTLGKNSSTINFTT